MPAPLVAAPLVASTFSSLDDFFSSTTWLVARNVALFFVTFFWLAIAWWAFRDARRRIDDPLLVGLAVLLVLALPFVGVLVYLLFRPAETLDDARERELELRALEERLGTRILACPKCRAEVEASFLVCPICTTRLKKPCRGCHAPLEPLWQVCPYCESPAELPGGDRPGRVLGGGAGGGGGAGVTVAPLGRRPAANE